MRTRCLPLIPFALIAPVGRGFIADADAVIFPLKPSGTAVTSWMPSVSRFSTTRIPPGQVEGGHDWIPVVDDAGRDYPPPGRNG